MDIEQTPNPSIVDEIKRRFNIMIENKHHENSTRSKWVFDMNLCLIGQAIGSESWMDADYLKPAMTTDEYYSGLYDGFVDELFKEFLKLKESINID
jgi:hypothetical protein